MTGSTNINTTISFRTILAHFSGSLTKKFLFDIFHTKEISFYYEFYQKELYNVFLVHFKFSDPFLIIVMYFWELPGGISVPKQFFTVLYFRMCSTPSDHRKIWLLSLRELGIKNTD